MATETLVTTICDMPHDPDAVGHAVTYKLEGLGEFEIDLCPDCVARLFVPIVENSRRIKKSHKKKS